MTEAVVIAVVVNFFATIGFGIKAYLDYKAKKTGNNPHPCAAHGKWIKELDDKLEKQAVELGKQEQSLEDMKGRLKRIEGILNGTYRK